MLAAARQTLDRIINRHAISAEEIAMLQLVNHGNEFSLGVRSLVARSEGAAAGYE